MVAIVSATILINVTVAYSDRTLSPADLSDQSEGYPCLREAIVRNERAGNPLRPWSAADVRSVRADCEARRKLAEQTAGILAEHSAHAEKR